MDNRVGKYDFLVEPFHVDFSGRIFLGVLGNQLLNSAGMHSSQRGFGIALLNDHHYTWVLSRLAIEMYEMPKQYEPYNIETWVENVYRLFTDRNFAITGPNGKVYGYGRSVWAMINLDDRKPADLLTLHNGSITNYIVEGKECPIEKPCRIKLTDKKLMRTITAYYSDIDINGHVNSIKYMEHALDLFNKEYLDEKVIERFEIAYIAESYINDTLSYYMQQTATDDYAIEIVKNEDVTDAKSEIVVRCRLKFKNK